MCSPGRTATDPALLGSLLGAAATGGATAPYPGTSGARRWAGATSVAGPRAFAVPAAADPGCAVSRHSPMTDAPMSRRVTDPGRRWV
jgi:hypothetical protein